MNLEFELFTIMNSEGKFLKDNKSGGTGWVASIEDARIYTKLGIARRVATMHSSKSDPCKIVVIWAKVTNVIDRSDYITKFRNQQEEDRKRAIEYKNKQKRKQELEELERLKNKYENEVLV